MSAAAILKLAQLQEVYDALATGLTSPSGLSPGKQHMLVNIQQLKTAMQLAAQVNALLQMVSGANISCDQVNAFVSEDALDQRRAFCGTLMVDGKKKCVMKEKVCRAISTEAGEEVRVLEEERAVTPPPPGEAPAPTAPVTRKETARAVRFELPVSAEAAEAAAEGEAVAEALAPPPPVAPAVPKFVTVNEVRAITGGPGPAALVAPAATEQQAAAVNAAAQATVQEAARRADALRRAEQAAEQAKVIPATSVVEQKEAAVEAQQEVAKASIGVVGSVRSAIAGAVSLAIAPFAAIRNVVVAQNAAEEAQQSGSPQAAQEAAVNVAKAEEQVAQAQQDAAVAKQQVEAAVIAAIPAAPEAAATLIQQVLKYEQATLAVVANEEQQAPAAAAEAEAEAAKERAVQAATQIQTQARMFLSQASMRKAAAEAELQEALQRAALAQEAAAATQDASTAQAAQEAAAVAQAAEQETIVAQVQAVEAEQNAAQAEAVVAEVTKTLNLTPDVLEDMVVERARLLAAARDAQKAREPTITIASLPDLGKKAQKPYFEPAYSIVYHVYFMFTSEDDARTAASAISILLKRGMTEDQVNAIFEEMQKAKQMETSDFDTFYESLPENLKLTDDPQGIKLRYLAQLFSVAPLPWSTSPEGQKKDVKWVFDLMYEYYPGLRENARVAEIVEKLTGEITNTQYAVEKLSLRTLQRLVMFQDIVNYQENELSFPYYKSKQLPLLEELLAIIRETAPKIQSPAYLVAEAVNEGILSFQTKKQQWLDRTKESKTKTPLEFDTKSASALSNLRVKAAEAAEALEPLQAQISQQVDNASLLLQTFDAKINEFVNDNLHVELVGGEFFKQTAAQLSHNQMMYKNILRATSEYYAAAKEQQFIAIKIANLVAFLVEHVGRMMERAVNKLQGGQGPEGIRDSYVPAGTPAVVPPTSFGPRMSMLANEPSPPALATWNQAISSASLEPSATAADMPYSALGLEQAAPSIAESAAASVAESAAASVAESAAEDYSTAQMVALGVGVAAIALVGAYGIRKWLQSRKRQKEKPVEERDEDVLQTLLAKLSTLLEEYEFATLLTKEAYKDMESTNQGSGKKLNLKQHAPKEALDLKLRDMVNQLFPNLQTIVTFVVTLDAADKNPENVLARLPQQAVGDYDNFALELLVELGNSDNDNQQVAAFRAKYFKRYRVYFHSLVNSERKKLVASIVETANSSKSATDKIDAIKNATGNAMTRLDQQMNKVFELLRTQMAQASYTNRLKSVFWRSATKEKKELSAMDPVELIMLEPADLAADTNVSCNAINEYFPVESIGGIATEEDVTRRREMCVAMLEQDGKPKCRFYEPLHQCMTPEEFDRVVRTVTKQLDTASTEESQTTAYGAVLGTVLGPAMAGVKKAVEFGQKTEAVKALQQFAEANPVLKESAAILRQQLDKQIKDEFKSLKGDAKTTALNIVKDVGKAVAVAGAKYALRRTMSKIWQGVTSPFKYAYQNPVKTACIVAGLVMLYNRNLLTDPEVFAQIKGQLPGLDSISFQKFGELAKSLRLEESKTLGESILNPLLKFYDSLSLEKALDYVFINATEQGAALYSTATPYLASSFNALSSFFNLSALGVENVALKAAELAQQAIPQFVSNSTTPAMAAAVDAAQTGSASYLASMYNAVGDVIGSMVTSAVSTGSKLVLNAALGATDLATAGLGASELATTALNATDLATAASLF